MGSSIKEQRKINFAMLFIVSLVCATITSTITLYAINN